MPPPGVCHAPCCAHAEHVDIRKEYYKLRTNADSRVLPVNAPQSNAAIRRWCYSSNRTYSVRVYCSPEPSSFSLKRSVSR